MPNRKPTTESKSPASQSMKDHQALRQRDQEEVLAHQPDLLSQASHLPSVVAYGAMLNRQSRIAQSDSGQCSVLQLQRQYGNRYVRQIIAPAHKETIHPQPLNKQETELTQPEQQTTRLDILGTPSPNIFKISHGILATVYFGQNNFLLMDENLRAVQRLSEDLNFMVNPTILVEGYASTEGDEQYNLSLSEKRRMAVISILTAASPSFGQLEFKGAAHGEANLAVEETGDTPDETERQRALNRRVEIYILPNILPMPGTAPKVPDLSLPQDFSAWVPEMPQGPEKGALTGPTVPPASPPSPSQGLEDMLTFQLFELGKLSVKVELPKSLTAKLPIALSRAHSLTFELKAETSGTFSFSVTLDGLPHLRIAAKSQLEISKEKGVTGFSGLEFQLTRTVCRAANPEALRKKIEDAGKKLKTNYDSLNQVSEESERLEKFIDLVSAIGDMYDAVDKSQSSCSEVPAATLNLGIQGPLQLPEGALGTDPTKQPALYGGATLTIFWF